MTKAGFDSIEKGKQNGSWTILEDAEARFITEDLEYEFSKRPNAKEYFLGFRQIRQERHLAVACPCREI